MGDRFMLEPNTAYAYQMVPGYGGLDYYSPIIVHRVTPLKRGDGSFRLDFTNCFYAAGVQGMQKEFRMLHHTATHLVVADVQVPERTIIVRALSQDWLNEHCDGYSLKAFVAGQQGERYGDVWGQHVTVPEPGLSEASRLRDRFRGGLVGLAVGDVLGVPVEFKKPGTFTPVSEVLGGGAFNLLPGEWTDDTSMALCLAESLLSCQGFDAVDQLKRYVA
jgi:hypothetical protein